MQDGTFFVKYNKDYISIAYDQVLYVEGCRNYCKIMLAGNKMYLVHMPMHAMQELLPESMFCRIHKSYIVSLNRITKLDDTNINLGGNKIIPFGNVFKQDAISKIKVVYRQESITL